MHVELAAPCSPRCPIWLRYGVEHRGAGPRTIPGRCCGKAHRPEYLGIPGRRVLFSRKWSGKTPDDHRDDRAHSLTVDPRVVVNPAQARQVIAAVTCFGGRKRTDLDRGRRLYAFFASLYYAGLRLGVDELVLPADGWGELRLIGSLSEVSGAHYADSADRRRPLKRRRPEDVRVVPVPPVLVGILRTSPSSGRRRMGGCSRRSALAARFASRSTPGSGNRRASSR